MAKLDWEDTPPPAYKPPIDEEIKNANAKSAALRKSLNLGDQTLKIVQQMIRSEVETNIKPSAVQISLFKRCRDAATRMWWTRMSTWMTCAALCFTTLNIVCSLDQGCSIAAMNAPFINHTLEHYTLFQPANIHTFQTKTHVNARYTDVVDIQHADVYLRNWHLINNSAVVVSPVVVLSNTIVERVGWIVGFVSEESSDWWKSGDPFDIIIGVPPILTIGDGGLVSALTITVIWALYNVVFPFVIWHLCARFPAQPAQYSRVRYWTQLIVDGICRLLFVALLVRRYPQDETQLHSFRSVETSAIGCSFITNLVVVAYKRTRLNAEYRSYIKKPNDERAIELTDIAFGGSLLKSVNCNLR